VRNTAYTWLRKNRPSAVLLVEDLEAVGTARATPGDLDGETPETTLIAKAVAPGLHAAIGALRETMILRDLLGAVLPRDRRGNRGAHWHGDVAARSGTPQGYRDLGKERGTNTARRDHIAVIYALIR
jgi:hypothetical protein